MTTGQKLVYDITQVLREMSVREEKLQELLWLSIEREKHMSTQLDNLTKTLGDTNTALGTTNTLLAGVQKQEDLGPAQTLADANKAQAQAILAQAQTLAGVTPDTTNTSTAATPIAGADTASTNTPAAPIAGQ